jgi:hypothetical protein
MSEQREPAREAPPAGATEAVPEPAPRRIFGRKIDCTPLDAPAEPADAHAARGAGVSRGSLTPPDGGRA